MPPNLSKRLCAEFLGAAFLLAAVVGSGIMAERLANGNMALALLGNTLATGAILVVLITMFGPISGAHFNPAVTLAALLERKLNAGEAAGYTLAQIAGALAGVLTAHLMFAEELFQISSKMRSGAPMWYAEFAATFGLLAAIQLTARFSPAAVPMIVGLYIASAYWFTASTSFANPAVTIARVFTDSFAGIRLADMPAFVAAQLIGGVTAFYVCRFLAGEAAQRSPLESRKRSAPK